MNWIACAIAAVAISSLASPAAAMWPTPDARVVGRIDQYTLPSLAEDAALGPLHNFGTLAFGLYVGWGGEITMGALFDDPATDVTFKLGQYTYKLSEAYGVWLDYACCIDALHSYPAAAQIYLTANWAATDTRPSFVVGSEGAYFKHFEGPNHPFYMADVIEVRDFRNLDAIPEPSAWALMILGFGCVGRSLRRRAVLA